MQRWQKDMRQQEQEHLWLQLLDQTHLLGIVKSLTKDNET